MNSEVDVIAGVGLDRKTRKSHWPARLDWVQSASGLFLGLFMWGHMAFVSTILISNDAMWWVTKMFEGYFFFSRPYPAIVAFVVALAWLFAAIGSNWSLCEIVAVLVTVPVPVVVAVITRVTAALVETVPTVHTPELLL